MKKIIILSIIGAAIFAIWMYIVVCIDEAITSDGIFMAAFMTAGSVWILILLKECIQSVRNGEPLIVPRPPKPRRLPLWLRILDKIFP